MRILDLISSRCSGNEPVTGLERAAEIEPMRMRIRSFVKLCFFSYGLFTFYSVSVVNSCSFPSTFKHLDHQFFFSFLPKGVHCMLKLRLH